MNYLKTAIKFYINSSIHVALSVCSFLKITELYLGLPNNEWLLNFVFFGTITAYNFVKYAGVAKLHHRSLTNNLKLIQIFSFCCFLLFSYYFFHLKQETLFLIVPFGIVTLLYAVPFFGGFRKNLRSISYLKILIVSLVWSVVTVILPAYDYGLEKLDLIKTLLMALQRFLFVFVLILPFDIRDMKYDAISLQTIPKRIGVKQTKKIGFIILSICLVLEFLVDGGMNFSKSFLIIFCTTLFLLMRASEEQTPFYSSLGVEAIPIVWWLLLIIL
ncbi:UbiA prenyltransferase family protein [Tenacibaculum xiamenense]|uniref:hypothetical protein n=1 Tax=Tenacibaculum xiamenense TaxID=1261553 RepID=UPI0038930098